jgi:hypothetical protein
LTPASRALESKEFEHVVALPLAAPLALVSPGWQVSYQ